MIEIIPKVAAYLDVPEVSKDCLLNSLVDFPTSEDVIRLYDQIRSYERKGIKNKEILSALQNEGMDHLKAESILHEYRSIRKVSNSHRGKRKITRGLPILLLGVIGFISVYFIRNKVGIGTLGTLCIASFVCIIISGGATFGGLLQVITGWD